MELKTTMNLIKLMHTMSTLIVYRTQSSCAVFTMHAGVFVRLMPCLNSEITILSLYRIPVSCEKSNAFLLVLITFATVC